MFGLGPWELLIVLIVLVFFYGGRRLGEIGEGLGKSISEFKKAARNQPSEGHETKERIEAPKDSREAGEIESPAGLREEPAPRKPGETRVSK